MGYLVVYGAGFLLPQVGGFQVGQMQLDGDGVFIVGHAYGKIPAPCSVIKATHVPADILADRQAALWLYKTLVGKCLRLLGEHLPQCNSNEVDHSSKFFLIF